MSTTKIKAELNPSIMFSQPTFVIEVTRFISSGSKVDMGIQRITLLPGVARLESAL